MIPIKKFEHALQKEKPCTLAAASTAPAIKHAKDAVVLETWASNGGQWIRMVCAMYKDCKRSKNKCRVCMTKVAFVVHWL